MGQEGKEEQEEPPEKRVTWPSKQVGKWGAGAQGQYGKNPEAGHQN